MERCCISGGVLLCILSGFNLAIEPNSPRVVDEPTHVNLVVVLAIGILESRE